MSDLTNTPPAAPTIPIGLATVLGGGGATILGVVSLVTAVLYGDHTPETLTSLVLAVVLLGTVIVGRMKQAAAIYHNAPSPLAGIALVGDYVEKQAHDEVLVGVKQPTVPPGLQG